MPSSDGSPSDPGAGEGLSSGNSSPEAPPSASTAAVTPGDAAATGGGPVPNTIPVSTTGVPHYSPPAAPPHFPYGTGVGDGSDGAAVAAPPREQPSRLRPFARGLREVAETVILALLIFLLVRAVVQNFQVEGRSMEPTLESGWYLLVNKAIYWEINLETVHKFLPFVDPGDDPTRYIFRGPKRGDVIVFRAPNQGRGQAERDYIKRVIAVPGETVEIHDCTVFIDGEALDEPYVKDLPRSTYESETVPPGHYFVLGDNRNASSDSRTWGMLPKENIIGQAWLNYWPFSAFGLTDNTSVEPGAAEGDAPAGKPATACS